MKTVSRMRRLKRSIGLMLALALLLAGTITYLTIVSRTTPLGPRPQQVWMLLLINLSLLLALCALIGRRALKLAWRLRRGLAGSRLQRRMVGTFSLVAILPVLVVTIFSIFFFNLGIQAWFNERVQRAVTESLAVAEAYMAEHRETIRAEAVAMADDLNPILDLAFANPVEFNRAVSARAGLRSIPEVMVFQRNRIIAQGRYTFAAAFESLPMDAIERARDGEVVLLSDDDDGKVRALVALNNGEDTYLLVGRLVDSKVLSHMEKTQGAVKQYNDLQRNIGRLRLTFSLVFVSFALLLVLSSVWYGIQFAILLLSAVAWLVEAAERVRGGDYDARVATHETHAEDDEIETLLRTFNRMTEQLAAQRGQLIEANRRLDARRRFSEAVLSGVSAGVLALDAAHRVTLANRSAEAMLSTPSGRLEGTVVEQALPGIEALLAQAGENQQAQSQGTLSVGRGEKALTLHARVSAEVGESGVQGYIVTFDDITPMVAAERHAAWSDVARRVAHEIKNPLTPIALAAERIKRKYGKYIAEEESETFTRYTDTISRHVSDIGRMVEEFVGFARMPNPVFKEEELSALIRKAVFSEQVAHGGIHYRMQLPDKPLPMECDERQLTQALGNILKNAAESLEGHGAENPAIDVRLSRDTRGIAIEVRDNGPGFPPDTIERMLEPYFTTRAKGTGLGLAIARKIVEEHKGELKLANAPAGGAIVTLFFLT